MKIFKLMAIALVAMLGFTACDKETEHIYDDHSADLVGTWTCLTPDFAEALVINADGSLLSTGFTILINVIVERAFKKQIEEVERQKAEKIKYGKRR